MAYPSRADCAADYRWQFLRTLPLRDEHGSNGTRQLSMLWTVTERKKPSE